MWQYKGEQIVSIDQIPEEAYGFIYLIKNLSKIERGGLPNTYVGKKSFWSERKIKLGKRELAAQTDKRKSKSKVIKKQSDWLTYCGSNELLKEEVANGDIVYKEILCICKDKMCLTYNEVKMQFFYEVIEKPEFYNSNVLGSFYKGNLGNIL